MQPGEKPCRHLKCRLMRATPKLAVYGLLAFGAGLILAGHREGLVAVAFYVFASQIHERTAYKLGWLRGRTAMVASMTEANRRRMHPNDWLQAEIERDAAMLGVPLPKWGDHE